jgi:lipid-binding SYLF domain-containing protein
VLARRAERETAMMRRLLVTDVLRTLILVLAVAVPVMLPAAATAASKSELNASSRQVLDNLLEREPAAKALYGKSVAVLVFPSITKAGFMVGGQYGEGVLWKGGKPIGYYNTAGASWGLQAGAQKYGYAMFFMRQKALDYLDSSQGFEVGVGPSVVVIDQGMAKSLTSTTLTEDVYAFIFSQQGLMAGVGIQGNKITRLNK